MNQLLILLRPKFGKKRLPVARASLADIVRRVENAPSHAYPTYAQTPPSVFEEKGVGFELRTIDEKVVQMMKAGI